MWWHIYEGVRESHFRTCNICVRKPGGTLEPPMEIGDNVYGKCFNGNPPESGGNDDPRRLQDHGRVPYYGYCCDESAANYSGELACTGIAPSGNWLPSQKWPNGDDKTDQDNVPAYYYYTILEITGEEGEDIPTGIADGVEERVAPVSLDNGIGSMEVSIPVIPQIFERGSFARNTEEFQFIYDDPVHGPTERSYLLSIPDDTTEPFKLIINMHSYGGFAVTQQSYSEMDQFAHPMNMAVAYPQGLPNSQDLNSWNVGSSWDFNTYDDIGFISKMIDHIDSNEDFDINLERVYACGYSNGGYMAYELACKLPHRIAAFGSVAGNFMLDSDQVCNHNRKIPFLHIHGEHDSLVNYYPPSFDGSLTIGQPDEAVDCMWPDYNCNIIDYWKEHHNLLDPIVESISNDVERHLYFDEGIEFSETDYTTQLQELADVINYTLDNVTQIVTILGNDIELTACQILDYLSEDFGSSSSCQDEGGVQPTCQSLKLFLSDGMTDPYGDDVPCSHRIGGLVSWAISSTCVEHQETPGECSDNQGGVCNGGSNEGLCCPYNPVTCPDYFSNIFNLDGYVCGDCGDSEVDENCQGGNWPTQCNGNGNYECWVEGDPFINVCEDDNGYVPLNGNFEVSYGSTLESWLAVAETFGYCDENDCDYIRENYCNISLENDWCSPIYGDKKKRFVHYKVGDVDCEGENVFDHVWFGSHPGCTDEELGFHSSEELVNFFSQHGLGFPSPHHEETIVLQRYHVDEGRDSESGKTCPT